ncbi:MAG: hypothetical protein KME57_30680 [Scytonema hyalinum WJT4-NPBG1]|jgi:hypothetical protein|nr:hypothetical protein [Scytonema hyalinum WJT4-NPBG1]
MDSLTESKKDALAMEVFAGGGEMGARMRTVDLAHDRLSGCLETLPGVSFQFNLIAVSPAL